MSGPQKLISVGAMSSAKTSMFTGATVALRTWRDATFEPSRKPSSKAFFDGDQLRYSWGLSHDFLLCNQQPRGVNILKGPQDMNKIGPKKMVSPTPLDSG